MSSIKSKIIEVSNKLNKVNQFCVGILISLLILDVWIAVIDRYLFHWQLSWVEELARYIMIWAILLAVPCCTANREHMGLEFIVNKFSNQTKIGLQIFMGVLLTLFFAYLSYAGVNFAQKGSGQVSSVFALPMSYAYAAIPITFLLSAIQSLFVVLQDIYKLCELKTMSMNPYTEKQL